MGDILDIRGKLLLAPDVTVRSMPETLVTERVMLGTYPGGLGGHYDTRTLVAFPT